MALGEYLGAGNGTTKLLAHLNGDATDSSGNGNNGVSTNITWTGGKIGSGSASFNGTNSKAVSSTTSFTNNQDIITSVWVNITTNPASPNGYYIISVPQTTNQSLQKLYYITLSGVQYIRLSDTSDSVYTASYAVNLAGTGWRHICAVKSGTGVNQQLYLDGIAVGTPGSSGTATTPYAVNKITIGRDGYSDVFYFNGLMDELIIESRAWSATEIKKHYTYSKGLYGIL